MKIVINRCYGGFSVTKAVFDEMGLKWDHYGYPDNSDFGIESGNYNAYRSHEPLIKAIEKIGLKESSGRCANLDIVEVPDDIEWQIDEHDGQESVHENHRVW